METEKNVKNIKRVALLAILVAIVFMLFSLVRSYSSEDVVAMKSDVIMMMESDSSTYVALNDTLHFFEETVISVVSDAADKAAAVMTVADIDESNDAIDASDAIDANDANKADSNDHQGGTLWYVDGKDKAFIADDVYHFVISDGGQAIAYLTSYDEHDQTGALYIYDAKKKKQRKIADEALPIFTLSPDGKTISYAHVDADEEGDWASYIKRGNKKAKRLGSNQWPIAVSDKGKYIYYAEILDSTNNLADINVSSGKKTTRLRSKVYLDELGLFFNRDYTQVFLSHEGRSYMSNKAKDIERLGQFEIASILLPQRTIQQQHHVTPQLTYITYGVEQLSDRLVQTKDDELYFINRKFESKLLARDMPFHWSNMALVNDGKTILYVDERGRLMQSDVSAEGMESENIATDVRNFVVSPDGKSIYYVNEAAELVHHKRSGKIKHIDEDVNDHSLSMSADGRYVFYLTDYRLESGALYYTKNGSTRKKIADDIHDIVAHPAGIYYRAEAGADTYDLYFSSKKAKFKLLQHDVTSVELLSY